VDCVPWRKEAASGVTTVVPMLEIGHVAHVGVITQVARTTFARRVGSLNNAACSSRRLRIALLRISVAGTFSAVPPLV
jgi:hypothetical protein